MAVSDAVGLSEAAAHAVEILRAPSATSSPGLASGGSLEGWAGAVGDLQRVIDVASAAQDAAIVALAAIEVEALEDGTLREGHRAPGHVALDAPAIVSGVLCVSAVHAQARVQLAVRLVADGPGAARESGLGGLHEAMVAGRLDSYRALVIASELEEVPAQVAAGVLAALDPFFEVEDAPRLRRRCRRVLARVSPDLLRQRAVRARAESGLRRWVEEPGVDRWEGTFPSEDAARAWAAIDALAQQYVTAGVCERIDRARAKALTDLVEGSATIETILTLTIPAETTEPAETSEPAEPTRIRELGTVAETAGAESLRGSARSSAGDPGDLVEVVGLCPGEAVLVERGWLEQAIADTIAAGRDKRGRVRVLACERVTGAGVDPTGELSTGAYRPGKRLVAFVKARDGHCRFPGCHVSSRFCDLDHVTAWPAGPTTAANLICLCRRHHRIKQRPGWAVTAHPDATVTWTDPTGRTRATHPLDTLHGLTLHAPTSNPSPGELDPPAARHPMSTARTLIPDGPHTPLEFALEHHLGGRSDRHRPKVDTRTPLTTYRLCDTTPHTCHSRRRRSRSSSTDPPPF